MSLSRVVESEAEADAIVNHLLERLGDMSPFFRKLEEPSGALDVSARETWDKRFGIGVRHAPATVRARSRREGYYENTKTTRATSTRTFLLWTGSLERAASEWTRVTKSSASIDPDLNYRGPLEDELSTPFTSVVSEWGGISDEMIWQEKILGPRIERELWTFLLNVLEGRAAA